MSAITSEKGKGAESRVLSSLASDRGIHHFLIKRPALVLRALEQDFTPATYTESMTCKNQSTRP